jgi:hypothetical protein
MTMKSTSGFKDTERSLNLLLELHEPALPTDQSHEALLILFKKHEK